MSASEQLRTKLRSRLESCSAEQVQSLAARLGVESRQSLKLRAFVSPVRADDDCRLTEQTLRDYLTVHLPEHMRPSGIQILERLPRLPNGKLDAAELSKLQVIRSGSDGQQSDGKPQNIESASDVITETESHLLDIWAESLQMDRDLISVHDDFFEIGGDSILSIHAISRARQRGLNLHVEQIFEHKTIAAIAATIQVEVSADTTTEFSGKTELTPIQHWFFEEVNDPRWNQGLLLDLENSVCEQRLGTCVNQLVNRHDVLRAQFNHGSDGWAVQIADEGNDTDKNLYQTVRLDHVPAEQVSSKIEQHLEDCQLDFDWGRGQLLAVVLFHHAGQRQLAIVAHHLIMDAMSLQNLLFDLEALYRAAELGESSPPLPASYGQWALDMLKRVDAAVYEAQLGYWQSQRVTNCWPPGAENHSPANPGQWLHNLSVEQTTLLKNIAGEDLSTEFLLITALLITISNSGGGDAICLGIERQLRGSSVLRIPADMLGWTTAYFPVRFELNSGASLSSRLQQVAETMNAIPDKGVGYGMLRYVLSHSEKAELKYTPSVLFNFMGEAKSLSNSMFKQGQTIEQGLRGPGSELCHPLEVNAEIVDGSLKTSFTAAENLLDRAVMESLVASYARALQQLSAMSDESMDTIGLMLDSGLDDDDLETLMQQLS